PWREDATRLTVESALVRNVHLDVLADHDVERARVVRKLGDIGDADIDHVAQPDSVVEPFGNLAVLRGEIDGRDPGTTLGGDQPRGPADSAAGIEDTVGCGDFRQVDQGGRGEAPEGMEILECRQVRRMERVDVLTGLGQGLLDLGAGEAGGVGLFDRRRHAGVSWVCLPWAVVLWTLSTITHLWTLSTRV